MKNIFLQQGEMIYEPQLRRFNGNVIKTEGRFNVWWQYDGDHDQLSNKRKIYNPFVVSALVAALSLR